jgi:hypothetical protein
MSDLVVMFVDAQTVLLFGRQKFQFFLTLLLLRPENVVKLGIFVFSSPFTAKGSNAVNPPP